METLYDVEAETAPGTDEWRVIVRGCANLDEAKDRARALAQDYANRAAWGDLAPSAGRKTRVVVRTREVVEVIDVPTAAAKPIKGPRPVEV
jgi:hypothetical protein